MEDFAKQIKKMKFREAMVELNNIVESLESNSLELEESLVCYQKGVMLLSDLQKRIDEAQQKVDVLMGELEQDISDEEQDTTLS